jgi:hypothetical protein
MTEAEYLAKASDPTTTEGALLVLWEEAGLGEFPLGTSVGLRIRKAIVQNPNLPVSLVRDCFGQLATAFAQNPALPLFCLENPNLADDAPEETVLRLLKHAQVPSVIVEILCRHRTRAIAEAARLHVALNPEVTEERVRQELRGLPSGGKSTLKQLYNQRLLPQWLAEAHGLGERSDTTLPEVNSARSPTGLGMVMYIAAHDYPAALHNFVLERLWFRRLGAALNPRLTEKDRKRLVDDANAIVRAVAQNTKLRDRLMERSK